MIKQTITTLAFAAALSITGFAQTAAPADQDPKAKVILDDVSKTTKAYKSITAEYEFVNKNKDGKQVDKQEGKIQVKGNKFRLEIPGNTIVCDGKTVWTHNKDAQEVTIKNFEPDAEDALNPTTIFTMYEKGFKYKYDKEEKINGVAYQEINLYPAIKPEKKKYHQVKLFIDKVKKQVHEVKMLMKDQGSQTYTIKSLKPNENLADSMFTFDTKGFKSDQIIDEREGK